MNHNILITKTAGIIIIGNEILSGKIHDSNSYFLASELRGLGVSLRRISVIPDEIDIISNEVVMFSERYDLVFTSGGVGPTHDDVTMEGIAKGFNVSLISDSHMVDLFSKRYGVELIPSIIKMTMIPEGAEVIHNEDMKFPAIRFKNIYIFPGIPEYLKAKFSSLKERFRTSSFYLKKIFLNVNEPDIALLLSKIVNAYPDVDFGSYPVLHNPEFKIMVTVESKNESSVKKAVTEFLGNIPQPIIVRVE